MNSFFKSKTAFFAFGVAAIVMMSLAPASATTVVRDHRGERADGGGVAVKDSPTKRKSVHIRYKNPACLGPFCL